MTIDGAVLDGVNQGDGSHMVGATITLNSSLWTPIAVTDNDNNFQDSDSSQRLDGPHTIDGVTYSGGQVVEAEYQLTVTDGTDSWTVIAFNINNSSPAYGTVEGLAFIGDPGSFPPRHVELTVTQAFEGPNFVATNYATPVCFVAGTRIMTPNGERNVENLQAGDRVVTRDHGTKTLRWVGRRKMTAKGRFAPIEIAAGALNNARALYVSPQHRMLLTDWRAELLFGEAQVLVPAIHLTNDSTIRQCVGGFVTYVHLMFDQHEIIFAEGAPTESFFPGEMALSALETDARDELLAIFPELKATFGPTARRCLSAPEAALITQRSTL
ncbi:MAG: Hint domain-containing protein [Pseudomonadota bacterium]